MIMTNKVNNVNFSISHTADGAYHITNPLINPDSEDVLDRNQ